MEWALRAKVRQVVEGHENTQFVHVVLQCKPAHTTTPHRNLVVCRLTATIHATVTRNNHLAELNFSSFRRHSGQIVFSVHYLFACALMHF